jgi:hypothetical protein
MLPLLRSAPRDLYDAIAAKVDLSDEQRTAVE